MAVKTLYWVLGVEPTASKHQIDDAFLRIKARHPSEKLATDEAARNHFQAVQQAYAVLGNPDSRSVYDIRVASAGVRVATTPPADDMESPWLTTRNIMVAGLILLAGCAMWFYHARELDRARAEKEIADRVLKLAEQEKQRRADLAAQSAQQRQAAFEAAQERQQQAELQRGLQQLNAQARANEQQAEAARRRAQSDQQQQERAQQAAQRQAQADAQRRVQDEKRQLRELCMLRYNRPDC